MEFLDPDNEYCPFFELFKGNVRLLFSIEASVRDEAIARILYMLLSYEQGASYLPNISNISDVIPNSVCILDSSYDPQKVAALQSGTYDRTSMRPLIDLLACNDVEPSVRKATFTQLNVMVQDPQLNDILNKENGLFLVLQALQNSLKVLLRYYHIRLFLIDFSSDRTSHRLPRYCYSSRWHHCEDVCAVSEIPKIR